MEGVSGAQSNATRATEARTIEIVRSKYQKFNLRSFSAANLQDSPLLFLGTLTPSTTGRRKALRICLVLANLRTGKIAAKVTTRDIHGPRRSHPGAVLSRQPRLDERTRGNDCILRGSDRRLLLDVVETKRQARSAKQCVFGKTLGTAALLERKH
jgi:hypothetical protein